MSFDYNIIGKLVILEGQGKNKLYEREYTLKNVEVEPNKNQKNNEVKKDGKEVYES